MASRDASIRVSLRSGAFNSETKRMESRMRSVGRRMGTALREPISKGLNAAKQSISDIHSVVKSTIQTAATLGGALSVGGAIKTVTEGEVAYLQLADALSTFSGKLWEAAEAQNLVERTADKTKIPIEDLRTTLLQLSAVSGKVDIASLLERASEQARRLSMNGEFIGRVYTRLVAKGVATTAEEAENLTEQFYKLFRQMHGADLDEAIDPADVAELSAFINTTGNSAAEMLKLISFGGEKIAKDFGKANEMVEELGLALHQTKGIDEITDKLKLPKNAIDSSKSALENMFAIADLGPRKFQKLADALGTDLARQGFKEVIGIEYFEKKVSREKWDIRVAELRKQFQDLGDLAIDRSKIEEADARHRKTVESQFNDAMNTLKKAFSDKEMQESIGDLAENLPELAKAIAELVSFISKNPLEAVIAGVGLKVGGSFLTSALGNAGGTIFRKLFNVPMGKVLGGGTGTGGATGGGGVASSAGEVGLAFRGLANAGKGVTKKLAKLGEPFAGRSGVAGKAMLAASGLAAAGAAGYVLGDQLWDMVLKPLMDADFDKWEKADDVAVGAKRQLSQDQTIEQKMRTLEEIRKTRADVEKGPSIFTGVTGTMASLFSDVDSPAEMTGKKLRALDKAALGHEVAVRKQMASQLESAGQFNTKWNQLLFDPLKDLNTIMRQFKATMKDVNRNPGSSRGPSKVSNQHTPGSEDKRG